MSILIFNTSPDGKKYQPFLQFENYQAWRKATVHDLPMQDVACVYGHQNSTDVIKDPVENRPWVVGVVFSTDNKQRLNNPHLTEWKIIARGEKDCRDLLMWVKLFPRMPHMGKRIDDALDNLTNNFGW